jgi:drug/metabolite transporter (DMT)-like permease
MHNRDTFKYLAAVILFGSNGVVASHIAMSSYDIVFTRTLIGALFLVAVFVSSRTRPTGWRDRRHFAFLLASGVAMGMSWLFLFEAYTQVGVSVATLTYYCGPVIVMVLAPLVFREHLALSSVIGFLAVVVGMVCVNAQALAQGEVSLGLVFGLLAAIAYSVMVILNKKAGSITGLENPMWQLIAAFGTVAVFVLLKQGLAIHIPPGSWVPVLVLGFLNTGVGCYLYFSAIGGMRAQSVAILGYLEPLSALLFAAAFLGESLGPLQWVGAALILGGAVFSELLRQRAINNQRIEPALQDIGMN